MNEVDAGKSISQILALRFIHNKHNSVAYMLILASFTNGRHETHGPTIAVIECPNIHQIKSGIRALEDFPCISVPPNARDCQYQVC